MYLQKGVHQQYVIDRVGYHESIYMFFSKTFDGKISFFFALCSSEKRIADHPIRCSIAITL